MRTLSAREVAEATGINYGAILRAIRRGELVARRVGRGYRLHPQAVEDFLLCRVPENRQGSSIHVESGFGASMMGTRVSGRACVESAIKRLLARPSPAT
jgi:excisionase family DNA binding protein